MAGVSSGVRGEECRGEGEGDAGIPACVQVRAR